MQYSVNILVMPVQGIQFSCFFCDSGSPFHAAGAEPEAERQCLSTEEAEEVMAALHRQDHHLRTWRHLVINHTLSLRSAFRNQRKN